MCMKHSLPLGFLIGLIWAIVWPAPGKAVANVVVARSASDPRGIRLFEFLCNVFIFLISGLTLHTDDFRGLVKEWKAPVYGLVTVLVLTPMLALGLKVRVDAPAIHLPWGGGRGATVVVKYLTVRITRPTQSPPSRSGPPVRAERVLHWARHL